MYIGIPQIHLGLTSREIEAEFTLPRSTTGQGYGIYVVAPNRDNIPDEFKVQKWRETELGVAASWQDEYKCVYRDVQSNQYSIYSEKRSDDIIRIFGGDTKYRVIANKPGLIVYFAPHNLSRIEREVIEYICIVEASIRDLSKNVSG